MTAERLPRTIQLDPSDRFVFENAAEPGEWAVTGSFLFLDTDPTTLVGKQRVAFRSGFVGTRSFGFSTLVVVSEASAAEFEQAAEQLAGHFRRVLGAPDDATALAAAREEIAFAASLCRHPVNTVIGLHRAFDKGEIMEQFRTLKLREPTLQGPDRLHAQVRAFQFVETDEEPEERLDLAGLAGGKRP